MTQQPRRARRTDANQERVVARFEQWGLSVIRVNGEFDLAVSCGGPSFLIEVKNPNQPPSKRRLTENESKLKREYKGEIIIVMTDADVDAAAKRIRLHWMSTTRGVRLNMDV